MNIIYHETSKTFHIYNDKISYIMKVLPNNHLGHLYFGKAIKDRDSFDHMLELYPRDMAAYYEASDGTRFSLEHVKQEYPSFGHGDQRLPAYDIKQSNGSRICEFEYDHHTIIQGKPKLKGLPATYVESDEEAMTLIITLKDHLLNMYIDLSYSIYKDLAVLCRNTKFYLEGESVVLDRAMSMCLDLPHANFNLIELTGAWSRERHMHTRPLDHGITAIQSLRGHSSHQFNPFIALTSKECNEFSGEVYGFSFVYSGNFLAQVEVDPYNVSRVTMGIHPHMFSNVMHTGDSFQSPEVVMVYSEKGLNDMSHTYHTLYSTRLARGKYRDQVRPILINNWEGTYFDFNEEKILSMAKTASSLGIELFVLDDGWFGARNHDRAGLGDWYCNYDKLPHGIEGLSREIEKLGMKFGLWFEPESVNKDSDLYRTHPEWTLETPGRKSSPSRNQFLLDFSNPLVINYMKERMDDIIGKSKISYIKWDMNRSMSEVYSACSNANEQGMVYHKFILGVYELYDYLTTKYPDILFESCSSGGARFDPGMLYYAPQAWTSDDTDAIERLKIQYGSSLVYPISSLGAHVSASPNHQLHRHVSIETRANVAYFGTFGYELDINKMTAEEHEIIKQQVAFMKQYRHLFQFGTFYRILSPFENDDTVWMSVAKDLSEAIVGYYRPMSRINAPYMKVKLQGLDPNKLYDVNGSLHYGDELMNYGLSLTDSTSSHNYEKHGDYFSKLFILKEVK